MVRRKLTDTANHFGGVLATARWQGHIKQLEKPSSSRREISGAGLTYNRQHREKGKRKDGERVAEGPVVAGKRRNGRGAKRPCCL